MSRWFFTPRLLTLLILCCAVAGCSGVNTPDEIISPSNYRDWAPDQAVLPTADFQRNWFKKETGKVTLHNVRDCKHLAAGEYVVDYYDKTYDLSRLQAVDFIVMPFGAIPALAHTMLSFEFAGEEDPTQTEHVAVSVEVRKEKGEEIFRPLRGMIRQYEIMYVIADERDLIARQTNFSGEDVFLYRTKATPEDARLLFVDMLDRANELAERPEFYDLLLNNCTTNIARHVNRIRPNRIVYDMGVLMPGLSSHKAYMEGMLAGEGTFEELQARSNISPKAKVAVREDFSQTIRR